MVEESGAGYFRKDEDMSDDTEDLGTYVAELIAEADGHYRMRDQGPEMYGLLMEVGEFLEGDLTHLGGLGFIGRIDALRKAVEGSDDAQKA